MYLIRTACKTSKSYLEVNPFMTHNIPHKNKPFIIGGIFDKHVQVWKVRLAPKMKAPVHITDISTSIVLMCSHPYGRSSSEWRQCFCKQKKTNKLCKKCAQSILYSSRKIVINQKRWAYKYIWKRQRQGQSIQRVWFRQERAKPIAVFISNDHHVLETSA